MAGTLDEAPSVRSLIKQMTILKSSSLPETTSHIVHSPWFQRFIIAAILFAGVLAGIETDADTVASHGPLLRTFDAIVLWIFIIEAILKLAAHCPKPWNYFRDGWNVFDFIVVVLCLLPMDSQFAVVLRLGRTLRLLRLVSALPKLQLLVGALIKSFSSMGYVGLLLGLMFYIYGITGVHFFGGHDKEHFGSLPAAFLTLFQTVTLDDWKHLLTSASGDSPMIAVVYFVSFILLGTMIMLNLFIGIIMNSMSEMHVELEEHALARQPPLKQRDALDDLAAIERQMSALNSQLKDLRMKLSRSS
jgi:voltage-gated sodium channel